jgi:hypothetical protein
MGKNYLNFDCECGNHISVATYHHTGGTTNNHAEVALKCKKCRKKITKRIENVENSTISGASIFKN